ncbi:biotin/lipoyl-containing protein [Nitrospinota bacterium]
MRKFKITIGDKTHEVAAERDTSDPTHLNITVDGQVHSVQVEEDEAPRPSAPRPRPAPPPPAAGARGSGNIAAQIPGTVLSIAVSEGDSVNAGDKLLVLEAMKMENIISADAGGTVRAIHVKKGDKVETGQEMMEIA